MKKYAPYVILFLVAAVIWSVFFDANGSTIHIDGAEVDGPLGAFLGLLFAGGGIVISALVMLVVGAVLAVVFAGVGVIVIGAIGVAALAVAAAVSPLLLPILIPFAIYWLMKRSRRNRAALQEQAA